MNLPTSISVYWDSFNLPNAYWLGNLFIAVNLSNYIILWKWQKNKKVILEQLYLLQQSRADWATWNKSLSFFFYTFIFYIYSILLYFICSYSYYKSLIFVFFLYFHTRIYIYISMIYYDKGITSSIFALLLFLLHQKNGAQPHNKPGPPDIFNSSCS